MTYQEEKAKRAFELYQRGLPFLKVYAAAEKDGKFVVLENQSGKYKYSLAGGGVEEGEDNITAIKRELREELSCEVEIVRSLGTFSYMTKRKYQDLSFELECVAEVFYVRVTAAGNKESFGLEGEFNKDETRVVEISKQEMLENVAEFTTFGIKFE